VLVSVIAGFMLDRRYARKPSTRAAAAPSPLATRG
jgi:hypothetical protein